jgi:hypothetical protein
MLTTSVIHAPHRGHGGKSFDLVRCCPDMKSAEGSWVYPLLSIPYSAKTLEHQDGSAHPLRGEARAQWPAFDSVNFEELLLLQRVIGSPWRPWWSAIRLHSRAISIRRERASSLPMQGANTRHSAAKRRYSSRLFTTTHADP